MKPAIIAEIERILGDRATPAEREEIADQAIKIVQDKSNADALKVMEAMRKNIKKTHHVARHNNPDHPGVDGND